MTSEAGGNEDRKCFQPSSEQNKGCGGRKREGKKKKTYNRRRVVRPQLAFQVQGRSSKRPISQHVHLPPVSRRQQPQERMKSQVGQLVHSLHLDRREMKIKAPFFFPQLPDMLMQLWSKAGRSGVQRRKVQDFTGRPEAHAKCCHVAVLLEPMHIGKAYASAAPQSQAPAAGAGNRAESRVGRRMDRMHGAGRPTCRSSDEYEVRARCGPHKISPKSSCPSTGFAQTLVSRCTQGKMS